MCSFDTGPVRTTVPSVKQRRGEPSCGTRRKISRSSHCRALPVRTVRRRLMFRLSAKNPQMLGPRRVRRSRSCLPRSYGRAPHIPYVLYSIYLVAEEAFDGRQCPQFSSALLFFDAATVHFASAASTILVLYGLYAFAGRGVTVAVSQSIALLVRRNVPLLISWLFLTTSLVSFLAFCSPRPPCHILRNHISLRHLSCSLSSLPVPVMSLSLIKCHFLPPLRA